MPSPQKMSITFRAAVVVFILSSVAFAADQPRTLDRQIAELELKDGRVLKNVQVVGYAEKSLSAKWEGGRGTIPFTMLPPDLEDQAMNRAEKKGPRPGVSPLSAAQKRVTLKARMDRAKKQIDDHNKAIANAKKPRMSADEYALVLEQYRTPSGSMTSFVELVEGKRP